MLPIQVDISEVISEFSLSDSDVKSLCGAFMDRFTDAYMEEWRKLVREKTPKIAQVYIANMNAQAIDEFTTAIILNDDKGKLPLMIERGASQFDLKEGFENSSKATKKNGHWYLTIPFTIATSEAVGSSPVFSGQMSKPIQDIAKNLAPKESLSVKNVPKELRNYGVSENVMVTNFPKYERKTFDFQGLQHNTKPNHGGYVMFRRVSDNSEENSWIHPGFEAHNFMEKTFENMTDSGQIVEMFKEIGDAFLENR